MSMILGMVTLTNTNLDRVLDDPPLIWRVIAPDDPGIYEQSRVELRKPSFFAGLLGGKPKAQPVISDVPLSANEGKAIDIDKAWHGIHYLLTGTAWAGSAPLSFIVEGGREVGDIDVGYGPARAFTAGETKSIHEALESVSDDELQNRFNPEDMVAKEIYPQIWTRKPEDDDTLGYLMAYVHILRDFLRQAVKEKHGLVIYVS